MDLVNAKCPKCDANIQINSELTVGFCMYCGSQLAVKEVVGKQDSNISSSMTEDEFEKKNNLFIKAQQAIDKKEYREASLTYKQIIDEIGAETPEAWWGIFYCTLYAFDLNRFFRTIFDIMTNNRYRTVSIMTSDALMSLKTITPYPSLEYIFEEIEKLDSFLEFSKYASGDLLEEKMNAYRKFKNNISNYYEPKYKPFTSNEYANLTGLFKREGAMDKMLYIYSYKDVFYLANFLFDDPAKREIDLYRFSSFEDWSIDCIAYGKYYFYENVPQSRLYNGTVHNIGWYIGEKRRDPIKFVEDNGSLEIDCLEFKLSTYKKSNDPLPEYLSSILLHGAELEYTRNLREETYVKSKPQIIKDIFKF